MPSDLIGVDRPEACIYAQGIRREKTDSEQQCCRCVWGGVCSAESVLCVLICRREEACLACL